MYEFVGGTGRLAYALYHAKEDPARIDRLADLLHYYPDQLKEDDVIRDRLARSIKKSFPAQA